MLNWSNILVALITTVPSSVGAYFAAKSKKYSKSAAHTGVRNESKLKDLSNGVMDEKIKRATRQVLSERRLSVMDDRATFEAQVKKAVTEVLNERPELVTEANIFSVMDRLLSVHLEEEK